MLVLFISSCQKEITVDLPDANEKICVEGKIEPGLPPYVILTHNMPYFGSTDLNTLQNLFLHNALILVSNGTVTDTLHEYTSQNIPDSLLPVVAAFTGVDTASLLLMNYSIYTTFNFSLWGTVGTTYFLSIDVNGQHFTSQTTIPAPIALDSLWPRYYDVNKYGDSLGYVFAHLTDPPSEVNYYRWTAMRLGKDPGFLAPFGSVTDDKFFNGDSFDFAYNRPMPTGQSDPPGMEDEWGYYKKGDTVVVKFCTLDKGSYDFFRKMDIALSSAGNPFAAPTSVPGNIFPREGALGVWCGYGTAIDTVIFR